MEGRLVDHSAFVTDLVPAAFCRIRNEIKGHLFAQKAETELAGAKI